jgi:hypothetical protein
VICALCGTDNEVARGFFSAVCAGCGGYLHCCIQCRLFCQTSRSCSSSTTDETGDPSHGNFCEEFEPLGARRGAGPGTAKEPADSARKFLDLFGNSPEDRPE